MPPVKGLSFFENGGGAKTGKQISLYEAPGPVRTRRLGGLSRPPLGPPGLFYFYGGRAGGGYTNINHFTTLGDDGESWISGEWQLG